MAREHRTLVSLDEIRGVRWQCNHCGAAIVYPLDQSELKLLRTCHACRTALVEPDSSRDLEKLEVLIRALKDARGIIPFPELGAKLTVELIE